jgi:peptidoglycan/xylan/chitin deacetylase (PgdA/CDA1 family)
VAIGAGGGGGETGTDEARGVKATAEVPTVTGFDGPVPILMYHAISPAPPDAALPDLFVPAEEFSSEMRWLRRRGYHGVTLDEVFAAWNDDAPIAKKPVVVSFDDGLRSQYVGAVPVLRRLAWPGVLNLKLNSLEQGELTDEMVSEMLDAGWEVDSHTINHLDVSELSGGDLEREVAGSRTELQERFGIPVNFFCYPSGRYDDEAIAAVREAGYLGATTTDPGLASPGDPYRLKRIRVVPGDGTDGLEAKLEAG